MAHDRQTFFDPANLEISNQQRHPHQKSTRAYFFEFCKVKTNHTAHRRAPANHKAQICSLPSFFILSLLLFFSADDRASSIPKPEPNRVISLVNSPQGTKQGTNQVQAPFLHLPPSASVCNATLMPSTRERGVEKTLQSPVGRGKEGRKNSAFMRLVLLVSFLCRGEFINGDKGFLGRKAIFWRRCLACVGGEEKEKKWSSEGKGHT